MSRPYLDPYARVGHILKLDGNAGRRYELLFNQVGCPIAFRIKIIVPHLGYNWVLHTLAGASIPKSWLEKSKHEEHDVKAFGDKVESFLRAATQL